MFGGWWEEELVPNGVCESDNLDTVGLAKVLLRYCASCDSAFL